MARQDEILRNFLNHSLIKEKYSINNVNESFTIENGIKSKDPIINAISYIVKNLEKNPPITDKDLQTQIIQLLNNSAI